MLQFIFYGGQVPKYLICRSTLNFCNKIVTYNKRLCERSLDKLFVYVY